MKHVDSAFTNPRILSYCPGILGLERGLKRAIGPIRTVAYVEIEAFICENLLAGMEAGLVDAAPIWCNLKTFDPKPFRGRVDGIIGGYPCQPFSHAGERKGTEDPRHLYPYLEQHIRTIQPVWCFFENVSGHLSLGFAEVAESLRNLGYSVEAGIFTAEEVGAPHERERLFILAIRREYLVNAKSAGIGRRQSDVHCSDGRQDGELQQQLNGSGATGLENTDCESVRNNIGRFYPETPSAGTELENSANIGQNRWIQQTNQQRTSNRIPIEGAGELGHSPSDYERWNRLRERGFSVEAGRSGDEETVGLADCNNKGLQRLRECCGPEGRQEQNGHPGSNRDLWPARPGQPQHEWEAPRVESSLGYAIDGYNYREDLLRAAGNSVVEQTAELAFRELFQKHFA